MFKRELRVDVVKKEKAQTQEPDQKDDRFEEKAKIIGKVLISVAAKIGVVVVACIAADTARQVIVEMAKDQ